MRLTRRRWRRRVVIAIVVLLVLVALDRSGLLLFRGDDLERYHGKRFVVAAVIDGDTIDLAAPDGRSLTTRVRLWGVNCPELARPSEGRPAQPWAEEATALTRELCLAQSVGLELEAHRPRGRYGRLLAHVRLKDGTLLNARLLGAGLARADARWSHARIDTYADLELDAKSAKRGLWAP